MNKKLIGIFILSFLLVLTGCGKILTPSSAEELGNIASSGLEYANQQAKTFVENNAYAQQAQKTANEVYDQAKQQAVQLSEKAKLQAQDQYLKLKEDAKAEAKNQINKKIDEAFERF